MKKFSLIPAIIAFCALAATCLANEEPIPWWRLLEGDAAGHFYFSRPETDARMREKRRARDTLVALVDGAQHSVELWCYGLDEPLLLAALSRAGRRGVELTITGDPETDYEEARNRGLNVATRDRSGIQHVKLALIDRRVFYSGTGNFTTSGFFHNNNAFFHLYLEREMADRLARGLHAESVAVGSLAVPFAGRVHLAPREGRLIQARLLRAILGARRRIRFMIFSFTDPVIAAALHVQARRGVIVEGIQDDEYGRQIFDPESVIERLRRGVGPGLSRFYLDGNFATFEKRPGQFHGGHLHHKTLIIDDERVLTGSYNWSRSARDRNLELLFDFDDPRVARRFLNEFRRLRARALLQSPALPVDDAPIGPGPALISRGETYCPDRPTPTGDTGGPESTGFTLFAGRGPYFRALRFAPGSINDGHPVVTSGGDRYCWTANEGDGPSAGLPRGGDYPLAATPGSGGAADTDLIWREPTAYSFDFSLARRSGSAPGSSGTNRARPAWPCEEEACERTSLEGIDRDDGWVWINPGAAGFAPALVRFWNREGFSNWTPLRKVADDFYEFVPGDGSGGGDQIVFLRDARGETRVACVQAGNGLDPTPAYWLQALADENNLSAPECLIKD